MRKLRNAWFVNGRGLCWIFLSKSMFAFLFMSKKLIFHLKTRQKGWQEAIGSQWELKTSLCYLLNPFGKVLLCIPSLALEYIFPLQCLVSKGSIILETFVKSSITSLWIKLHLFCTFVQNQICSERVEYWYHLGVGRAILYIIGF